MHEMMNAVCTHAITLGIRMAMEKNGWGQPKLAEAREEMLRWGKSVLMAAGQTETFAEEWVAGMRMCLSEVRQGYMRS